MRKVTEQLKRHYVVYIVSVIVALLAGTYVWAVMRTSKYHNEITVTQQELLVQVERERRVRDTAGVLSSLKAEREIVKTLFKTPDDVIAIIEEIEGFGRIVGADVSVAQVQVVGEDPETREGTFVVSIFAEGSWKQITNLLGLLDSLPYHAKMGQVTLDTTEEVDGSGEVSPWTMRASLSIALKK